MYASSFSIKDNRKRTGPKPTTSDEVDDFFKSAVGGRFVDQPISPVVGQFNPSLKKEPKNSETLQLQKSTAVSNMQA